MRKLNLLLLLIMGLLLSNGCTNEQTPDQSMEEFVNKWNKQEFSNMYVKLSANAQKSISKDQFVERYEKIYEDIGAKDLKVKIAKQEDEEKQGKQGTTEKIPYEVSMNTIAGPVSFQGEAELVQEKTDDKNQWKLNWNPSFLFSQLNEGETIQIAANEPKRGQIFDRNGQPLAINATVNEIGVVPGQLGSEKEKVITELSKELKMTSESIETLLAANWVTDDSYVPIKKLKPDQAGLVKKLTQLPGVMKKETESRYYPYGEQAAQLTGYIRGITNEELAEKEKEGYSPSSLIGVVGLESLYEKDLRGKTGWTIKIPESNEMIASSGKEDGKDIQVTIDIDKQTEAYEQLKGDTGAAVVLEPKTGETLALASTPSYDPNGFLFGWAPDEWDRLIQNPDMPFSAKFNKTYAPGSTIKPITAAIGIASGKLNPQEAKSINGKQWQKDSSWGGYRVTRISDALNQVNLVNALITSDNIYFAQTALDTGTDQFVEGLKSFGFEEELGYEFTTQKSTIANEGIKNEIMLADSGYGQGQMLMSPIHLAAAYTSFVNEGNMIKPYLLKKEGQSPKAWHEGVVSKDGASYITEGLKGVVEDPRGSAYKPVNKKLTIAGKTGTAELKASQDDQNGKENGWFVGYDYKNEDLLVTMMVQDVSKKGGSSYVVKKGKALFTEKH
ncbi:penicillin-binding transpeptidase domain-containing protein [Bacillus gobiensis]|uniref:penicillin-binding transpeptidase domain-containing protein n=1 Tax=Bacillus gobiensis TaxID=1441095 RepID=UPI003D1D45F4